MNLTEKQMVELWGDGGPYSEVELAINHRILDDSVSRIAVTVEANINPTTYKIIKKDRKKFSDDEVVQQLLDNANYQGIESGYLINTFYAKFFPEDDKDGVVIKEAQKMLEQTKQTIIKMHKYVMKIIDKPAISIKIK